MQAVVPAGYAVTEVRYGGANYLNSLVPLRGDTLDPSLNIVLTDQPGAVRRVDRRYEQSKPVAARIVLAPDPLPAGFDFQGASRGEQRCEGRVCFQQYRAWTI